MSDIEHFPHKVGNKVRPLFSFLFSSGVILAIVIGRGKDLKGIVIGKGEIKMSLFVDDMLI